MVKKVDSRGRSNTRKRGSNVKVQCQICGKVVTRSGIVGHMLWKHNKDSKAPLLDKEKPMLYQVAKRKAKDFDYTIESLVAKLFVITPAEFVDREARILVRLHDNVPADMLERNPEWLRGFVQKAVDRIKTKRGVSFDEAKGLLEESFHKAQSS